jgi:RHH-type proline utilization regulon transcriptional repressor/proline dehydrogenase/delta 1-pyrroline-5-carboxylate dehydrogenase
MLREAMRELAVGDPSRLATDVGPVIDAEARRNLETHVERMRAAGKPVFRLPLPPGCASGTFVAPTLIEIDTIGELEREVFGPVLHVVRFHRDRLDALVDEVNATGYGLTFGVHSRIGETIERTTSRVRAGNLYVNRNIVGAVVGVQPFGGEGKSGTGPKAGGPLYLYRLAAAREVSPAALATRAEGASDEPSPLDELSEWAQATGRTALAGHCRKYAKLTLAGHRLELPGPTGETNTLCFAPRGAIGCIAASAELLLGQLAAALATGNDAIYAAAAGDDAMLATLPAAVRAHLRAARDWATEPVALVLYAGEPPDGAPRRARLHARDGALVPVVPRDERGRYPLHRLVTERTVSVNTTAAGGNASLMTLAL